MRITRTLTITSSWVSTKRSWKNSETGNDISIPGKYVNLIIVKYLIEFSLNNWETGNDTLIPGNK